MEIRRFGVGNRRADGPPGTKGTAGQVIHADGRGLVSEIAFARGATIEPHSNPNTTWFIVIEGGGWVLVGAERARVAAGEAVLWPADTLHGAWTELSEMRAIVVEFAGPDDAHLRAILDARPLPLPAGSAGSPGSERSAAGGPSAGDGELAPGPADVARAAAEGEPL